jgi:alpha-glucosidase
VITKRNSAESRLHVKISDAAGDVYRVPPEVLDPPSGEKSINPLKADLGFDFVKKPFSFSVTRNTNDEVLFNTSGFPLIFQSQYLFLRTALPENPNIYGLGEHTDPFHLPTTNHTRTLWSRDAGDVPPNTNVYGNHPVYYDHRGAKGTHAVFFFNSNGMDVKLNRTAEEGQTLSYNTIGGIVNLYLMSGPIPVDAVQQYSEVVGKSAMMPYWGLGFHQCA